MVSFDADGVVHKLKGRLKIRHLALLLQIDQHGSLTRVASSMATSQPAVTYALAELEDMFGARLFDRTARGMTATAQGEVALAWARTMLNDLDALALDMEAVAAGRDAHLNVGATPFIPGRLLSTAIGHALPGRQRLTVTIHEATSEELLPMLRDHALDFAIGWASSNLDIDGLVCEPLFHQSPRLIASRQLAARLGARRLDWAQLAQMDWILGPRPTPLREQVTDIFLRAGVTPPLPVVESYSSRLIGEMIASSDNAVSILPADVAEELVRVAGVAIVPYSFDWTLAPVVLFSRNDGVRRPAETLFAEALRALCAQTGEFAGRRAYQY